MKKTLLDKDTEPTERFSISAAKTYYFGRIKRNFVEPETEGEITILDDPAISRSHCKICFDPICEKWTATDFGSLNGVYVKTEKGKPAKVGWEQNIRIGKQTYVYFSMDKR